MLRVKRIPEFYYFSEKGYLDFEICGESFITVFLLIVFVGKEDSLLLGTITIIICCYTSCFFFL